MDRSRAEFAQRQAEMTANWMAAVERNAGDVEAYIRQRQRAYLDRWREAWRFIPDGAKVLDIGGGNPWPDLLRELSRFDYHYLDVDPAAVAGARVLGAEVGIDPANFAHGFNDELAFEAGAFDAVFSSHCIEHSFDLAKTMRELWRVLRPAGALLMAVPFGWEPNPEHPYFFGPGEWCALVEDAGFEIRVAQVGREYPETGHDYFIAARKAEMPSAPGRVDPADYRKDSREFIGLDDPRIELRGEIDRRDDHAICDGDWSILIDAPGAEVMPVLVRHPWSAIVEIRRGGQRAYADLFSWFSYVQPALGPGTAGPMIINPVGRNPAARASQAALYGVLWR